jgi:hypothetical protein
MLDEALDAGVLVVAGPGIASATTSCARRSSTGCAPTRRIALHRDAPATSAPPEASRS